MTDTPLTASGEAPAGRTARAASPSGIDKAFAWLVVLSLVVHAAVLAVALWLPSRPQPRQEPVFIDLQQLQEPKLQSQTQEQARRLSEQRQRVEREAAPRGDAARDSQPRPQPPVSRPEPPGATSPAPLPIPRRESPPLAPGSSAASLLRPKAQAPPPVVGQPQLFPAASRLAKLEENYRRTFENDIAEGDTRFLNTDDILFGSFLRRFESAIYGVWRYPQEAAMKGVEGIVPVRITFSRNGNITAVRQLESSGSRLLDDEVLRTLRAIGPVGAFPKGYAKDEFHLIAFFQYGGARRSLR